MLNLFLYCEYNCNICLSPKAYDEILKYIKQGDVGSLTMDSQTIPPPSITIM